MSGNADAVISATRSDSTRPSPVSTLRSLTRAAPSSATVFRDRRQIAKSWSTLGSTRDAAVSWVSRRTTRPPSSNGSRLYSGSSATSMPTAPIAMAPESERPPMIVSAGYFSSRRAPSFQSSHETAVRPAFIRSTPPSARVGTSGHAHRAGGFEADTREHGRNLITNVRARTSESTLHRKVICVKGAGRGRKRVANRDGVNFSGRTAIRAGGVDGLGSIRTTWRRGSIRPHE